MKLNVYVVTWLQSYDGPLFDRVFGTKEQAEAYVMSHAVYTREYYDIEEYEVEIPDG